MALSLRAVALRFHAYGDTASTVKRRLADMSAADRVPLVDGNFRALVQGLASPSHAADLDEPLRPGCRLTGRLALELFTSQLRSRQVDFCSRRLKAQGAGFYTISSAGHEGSVAVAAALRPDDPAVLHYRSGGFFFQRAAQAGLPRPAYDVLLGVCASADEPIAGGRHKVFGSAPLWIPPQTSTIGSHLPKAVGMAFSLARASRLGHELPVPRDAIVVCSFGDASANHSTTTGAINAACWASHQGAPVPLLLVCEDNGLGISTRTPKDWIQSSYGHRSELRYVPADGLDLIDAYEAACEAADYVRMTRKPALLHMKTVRLLGHAGSDIETLYRDVEDIEATEARDPLLASARLLVEAGIISGEELLQLYDQAAEAVAALGEEAAERPRLTTLAQVAAPIAPRDDDAIAAHVAEAWISPSRKTFWGDKLPETQRPAPLGITLNRALGDMMVRYPEVWLFGEDVAHKGGVYGITRDLCRRGERGRVFDTLLDEQTILGIAIGAGHFGLLPIPEIQYLAYLHNAEDQLRGEAATLQFFSQGQYKNPMVVRIASYAYQKGFGGHFHNDNGLAVLRDIPGIIIATPSHPDDAVSMLQTCVATAKLHGSVCLFLEPIALYPVRDLHEKGDGLWSCAYQPQPPHVAVGSATKRRDGGDMLIVTFANGVPMSLRAARTLKQQHQIDCAVLDMRWLAPLPHEDILAAANEVDRVLVVDETRKSGGVAEGVITGLVEGGYRGHIARVCGADSFVPLGDAANLVLVQEQDVVEAAVALQQRQ